jgi:hypothetical protein
MDYFFNAIKITTTTVYIKYHKYECNIKLYKHIPLMLRSCHHNTYVKSANILFRTRNLGHNSFN